MTARFPNLRADADVSKERHVNLKTQPVGLDQAPSRATPFGDIAATPARWPSRPSAEQETDMREYRWFLQNSAAQPIAADRGRFLTDDDAMSWAAALLSKHATAVTVEVWEGAHMIGRRERVAG